MGRPVRAISILIVLALAGCTTTWSKPGATQRDFDVDKTACVSQAYQIAPVSAVPMTFGTGYTQPTYTSCTGSYGMANCVTTGGNYVPPTVVPVDVNRGARNAAFESCMYTRGWSKGAPNQVQAAPANASGHMCRFRDGHTAYAQSCASIGATPAN
jgi:hypothetical protein